MINRFSGISIWCGDYDLSDKLVKSVDDTYDGPDIDSVDRIISPENPYEVWMVRQSTGVFMQGVKVWKDNDWTTWWYGDLR